VAPVEATLVSLCTPKAGAAPGALHPRGPWGRERIRARKGLQGRAPSRGRAHVHAEDRAAGRRTRPLDRRRRAVVIVAAVASVTWYRHRTSAPPGALAAVPAAPAATAASPAPPSMSPVRLRSLLESLSPNALCRRWLAQGDAIRRCVVATDNLAEGVSPRDQLGALAPRRGFSVIRRGQKSVMLRRRTRGTTPSRTPSRRSMRRRRRSRTASCIRSWSVPTARSAIPTLPSRTRPLARSTSLSNKMTSQEESVRRRAHRVAAGNRAGRADDRLGYAWPSSREPRR
jgi:hypothetical protein